MPHISVEATPRLAAALDFPKLFAVIHRRMEEGGFARARDFKSRVLIAQAHLAGEDPDGEFLVARLMTTNPRTTEAQHAMCTIVRDVLTAAIQAEPRSYWWQCGVLNEPFLRADYFKTESPAAADK